MSRRLVRDLEGVLGQVVDMGWNVPALWGHIYVEIIFLAHCVDRPHRK